MLCVRKKKHNSHYENLSLIDILVQCSVIFFFLKVTFINDPYQATDLPVHELQVHFKQGQVNKVGVKDNNDHQAFDIMVVVKFKEERRKSPLRQLMTVSVGDDDGLRRLLQHHTVP